MAHEAPTYAVEATLVTRAGERIPVTLFGSLVLDALARRLAVVHIARSAPMSPPPPLSTEAQARLNQLLDLAPDAIIVLDEGQRILTFNLGAQQTFGYRAEEVLGQPLDLLLPPRFVEAHRRHIRDFAAAPEVSRYMNLRPEVSGRRKDGTEFPAQVSLSKLTEQGQTCFLAILQDITERKQRERELEAIVTVSAALRTAATRAEMLPVILDQLRNLIRAAGAAVGMRDPATGETVIELAVGSAASYSGARIPPGQSVTGHVIATGQIYSNDDARTDPRLFRPELLGDMRAVICVPLIAQEQAIGAISLARDEKKSVLPPGFSASEVRLLTAVANIAANAIHRASLHEQTERDAVELALAYDTTLEGWACALELRDKETEGHTRRVTEMAERLARAMSMSEAELIHLRRGALLHDMGKMGIPDRILLKPGSLTDEEWAIMRQHPQNAYDMLSPIAYLRPALDIPYCHHEKWDGTGYPRGLKGEGIPLAARIFAVADVWDALRSDRPYRARWPEEKVREYIREQAGKHFDPRVVDVFLSLADDG